MRTAAPSKTETLFLHERKDAGIPPVSVIIPLYNYARFVAETLDSVAMQTIADLDVVVVDDCSTDDSAAVACKWMEEHAARFRRATVLRHLVNGGLAATRNTGFGNCDTEFVLPLDADNLLFPTCLAKLRRSLASSRAAFGYCLVERFLTPAGEVPEPFLMHLHPWRPEVLGKGNKIDAMVLHRTSAWRQAGGYSLSMPCQGWEDYELWFRIARMGGHGLHVPQILARYRVHGGSMLHTLTNTGRNAESLVTYLRSTYPEFYEQAKAADAARRDARR